MNRPPHLCLSASMMLVTMCLPLAPAALAAEQTLQQITWSRQQTAGRAPHAQVVTLEGQPAEALRIEATEAAPNATPVLVIDRPPITTAQYAVLGQVRYEDADGVGYLEMWNRFPDGGAFFSRTLADSGPLASLSGSSDWRPFVLPFFSEPDMPAPVKLEINAVLPGGGRVWLGPLRLVQYERRAELQAQLAQMGGPVGPDRNRSTASNAWWRDRTGAFIGAIGGSAIGILGGLVGILGGLGRARRFVLGSLGAMLAFGIACLIIGIIAVSVAQPYAVWYPLVLGGVICTIVGVCSLPVLRLRYRNDELRRMRAMDASS